jgi:hypothetical protein
MGISQMGAALLAAIFLAPLEQGPGPGNLDKYTISSSDLVVGEEVVVKVVGAEPWSRHLLMCDLVPGDLMAPGGAWFGLGFSPSFTVVGSDIVPASGDLVRTFTLPDDPGLDGTVVYLQGAELNPTGAIRTSNCLEQKMVDPDRTDRTEP